MILNFSQRRFKALVERHGYKLVTGEGIVKNEADAAPTTPDTAATPTPKPRKRGRPSKGNADNSDETPTKKGKPDNKKKAANKTTEEDNEEDDTEMEIEEAN